MDVDLVDEVACENGTETQEASTADEQDLDLDLAVAETRESEGKINVPEVKVKSPLSSNSITDVTSTKDAVSQSRTDRRSGFAAVKAEFLVHDYKPKLHTEYISADVKKTLLSSNDEGLESKTIDETKLPDANEEGTEPPKKKAKLKGRNKHRPRNERIEGKDRICPAVKAGKECAYGEKCRFNHNVQDFLDKKMPDLDRPCPVFDVFGFCNYGVTCRFAKSHLNEKLENVVNEDLYQKMKDKRGCLNVLSEDVKHKLWKRKFNFKKADQVVKDIQKTFRGYGKDGAGNEGTQQCVADDGLKSGTSENPDNSDIVEDLNQSVNGVETKLALPSEKEAESVCKEVCDVQTTAKSSDCEKTLGTTTDEEMFPLRPAERTKIDFKNKLFLAPLTTVGNLPFRRLCKGFGAEITCGEMAVASQLLKGKQSEWSLIKRHPCEDIFGVQICGSYPDTMTRCAQVLVESSSIDFIDINCGCPIDLIFKKGCGCALMGKPTKLEQIARSMMGVMGDTPLTVKVRTGVFDKKNVAHTLIPRLRDAGVSLMTVHGRSREQRYTRLADWDYISQCATAGSPMPVFGNGDILSFEDANYHMEQNNVSGVMIARGALVKPWIFTEIKEQRHWDISSGERFDMLRSFANYGMEHWGSDHQGVENTRRFLLEWLSFLHRYIPVGVLEQVPQRINERPPYYVGRNDLETLMASANCADWVKISEMLLGPVPDNFLFLPKHKANAYQ